LLVILQTNLPHDLAKVITLSLMSAETS